jgi:hypothetical protein
MNIKNKLIIITKEECKKHKINLFLGKGKYVKYCINNIKVNGFFDFTDDKPKLACATGKPNWELTLVHELSHMHQWQENCKSWKDYLKIDSNVIDDSVNGVYVNEKKLYKNTLIVLRMERDCEQRAHALLKELGYPKDKLNIYIQKANAYTLFYLYVVKYKKWYSIGKEPYTIKSVWNKFPASFDIDIEKTFEKMEKYFHRCV